MTYITAQGDFIDKDLVCGTPAKVFENRDYANIEEDEVNRDENRQARYIVSLYHIKDVLGRL